MPVTKTKLEVRTADGVADCVAFRPEAQRPVPAVLFLFDAAGVRPAMEQMAEQLAAKGYFVLLPNLYYRLGAFAPFNFRTVFSDPPERNRLMAMIKAIETPAAMRDLEAIIAAAHAQPGVSPGPVGCVGYCMGGRLAFCAASALPDLVAASACIHAGHVVTAAPDSPHLSANAIRAGIYLGVADADPSCTPEHQAALRTALDGAKVRYQLELYSGAKHGFAVPDSAVFDAKAAEQHWQRVFGLFDQALR